MSQAPYFLWIFIKRNSTHLVSLGRDHGVKRCIKCVFEPHSHIECSSLSGCRKILPQGIRDASANGGDVSAAAVNMMPLKIHADGAQIDMPACSAICKSTMKAILEVVGWGGGLPFPSLFQFTL